MFGLTVNIKSLQTATSFIKIFWTNVEICILIYYLIAFDDWFLGVGFLVGFGHGLHSELFPRRSFGPGRFTGPGNAQEGKRWEQLSKVSSFVVKSGILPSALVAHQLDGLAWWLGLF